jgi:hypothetical protein
MYDIGEFVFDHAEVEAILRLTESDEVEIITFQTRMGLSHLLYPLSAQNLGIHGTFVASNCSSYTVRLWRCSRRAHLNAFGKSPSQHLQMKDAARYGRIFL